MKFIRTMPLLLFLAITSPAHAQATLEVTPRSEVMFKPLNPARGDASPKAGALWGDLRKDAASGAIIEFVDGFSSPPHIHNVTYRAVVISGMVHNDDPEAETMWMGPGSFWTQPAGESHITSAKPGARAVAFLEIFKGPYLVRPASKAFDNGERPVNLATDNVVWLNTSDISWLNAGETAAQDANTSAQVAFLWGDFNGNRQNGSFLKLPAGYAGTLRGNDEWLRAVVIRGQLTHKSPDGPKTLAPGSYFGGAGKTVHDLTCDTADECLVYVRTEADTI